VCRIGEKTVLTRGLDPVPEITILTISGSNSDRVGNGQIFTFLGGGRNSVEMAPNSGRVRDNIFCEIPPGCHSVPDPRALANFGSPRQARLDDIHLEVRRPAPWFPDSPLSGVVSVNPCPVRHIRLSDTVRDQAVVPCHRRHSVMQFSTSPLLADDDDSQRCK